MNRAITAAINPPGPVYAPLAGLTVLAGGCALLATRPTLVHVFAGNRESVLIVLFVLLAAVGLTWPVVSPAASHPLRWWGGSAVLVLGVAAFALGRLVGGGRAPMPPTLAAVTLNSLAAIAEEAFFRRFAYALLASWGTACAIAGTSILFAVVHVSTYGAWVLPIDLGAGLVLGWQRWASGSWRTPALTHVLANILVVI